MTENYMPKLFDKVFEEKLIQTILVDNHFGRQIMEVLEPECFGSPHTEALSQLLQDYYNQYEAFPSADLIPAILDKEISDPVVRTKCKSYLKKIQKTPMNGDLEYVKEKSLEFFRLQHILQVVKQDVLPRIEQGASRVDEIVSLMEKAVNRGTDNDLGYDYTADQTERFKEETLVTVPTGWDAFNRRLRGGGFGQKRIITLLAPPGAGKTTILCNIGKAALLQGKTVVYYTLELDWREIAEKFDASISEVEIGDLSDQKEIVIKRLKEKLPPSARLIIKEYPMKGASVQTIKNHLAKLKLQGIVPDEIFIDQGGLLKSSRANKEARHNLSNNWIEMKGLAQHQNIPVVTVHQINRTGYNEDLITLDMIAECFDIIGHSDAVITMARNLAQKKAGLGKILFGKNRQGEDGVVLAYAINGAKAMIDVFEMTEEVIEMMEAQKEDAALAEDKSVQTKFEKFMKEKKKKKDQERIFPDLRINKEGA